MRRLFIGILAVAVVFGMSMGVMAGDYGPNIDVDQPGDQNYAEVIDNATDIRPDSSINLVQSGFSNWAEVESEEGADTWMDLSQSGNNNYMDVSSRHVGYTDVIVDQWGNDNSANVTAESNRAHIVVHQGGFNNAANIYSDDASDSLATIGQYGNNNSASITQQDFWNDEEVEFVEATITQNGNHNTAVVEQKYND